MRDGGHSSPGEAVKSGDFLDGLFSLKPCDQHVLYIKTFLSCTVLAFLSCPSPFLKDISNLSKALVLATSQLLVIFPSSVATNDRILPFGTFVNLTPVPA